MRVHLIFKNVFLIFVLIFTEHPSADLRVMERRGRARQAVPQVEDRFFVRRGQPLQADRRGLGVVARAEARHRVLQRAQAAEVRALLRVGGP